MQPSVVQLPSIRTKLARWLLVSSLAGVLGSWVASMTFAVLVGLTATVLPQDAYAWVVMATAAAIGGTTAGVLHTRGRHTSVRRAGWWLVGWALLGAGGWLVGDIIGMGGAGWSVGGGLHDRVDASRSLAVHNVAGHLLPVVLSSTIVGSIAGVGTAAVVEFLVALFRDPGPDE